LRTWRHLPFGYRYVKHAHKSAHYEVDQDEAALVQQIFAWYVNQRWSQDAIAQQLTKTGVLPPGARRPGVTRTLPLAIWHPSAVADILRNETYIGVLHYGKKQRQPGKQNPDKKTRCRAVPREDWSAVAVPPIIQTAIFQAAQRLQVQNQRDSRRNRKHEYLFVGGRLRCGQCGRTMTGEINGHSRPRYKCGRKPYQDVPGTHTRRSVLIADVEEPVWAAVERALRNPALIAQEVERRRQGVQTGQSALDQERRHHEQQLGQCNKDLKRWEAAYLGEVIDLADFKAKKAEIDARRASVHQELARLEAQERLLVQATLKATALTDYCQRVCANLKRFDTAEKRLALDALHIGVVWHPDKPLDITGSIPLDIASDAVR
jgi:site-specific DNA recombinase